MSSIIAGADESSMHVEGFKVVDVMSGEHDLQCLLCFRVMLRNSLDVISHPLDTYQIVL